MSNLLKSKFLLGILVVVAFAFVYVSTAQAAITKTLRMGMRDTQVVELQQALNAAGFTVATTGAGSVGMETSYFGSLTKMAVQAFQSAKGLTADGIFGPLSRGALTTGGTSMTYPAGCTSAVGYSSTTGVSCSTGTTNTVTYPAGCNSAVGYSPTTGVKCDTVGTTTTTGPVTVMLSSHNPASGTLVAGQATADLAHYTFSGNGTVTGVVLKRLGVSADSTPSNVYLFDGATRLTDAASVSSGGLVTFTAPNGLFTVAGSKTVYVKSDIAGSTSGQTVGFQLVSYTTSAGTNTVNLSGNIHSVASATLAAVSAGTVTPSGATLNPGSNVTVWQSTLSISTRDVWMKRLALRNVGSAPANSFTNFKLYVNGVQVGTALGLDINGYVTFDLMSAPVSLVSGSRVVRVDADIVSGASRTVNFSLRNAADVDFVDSSFGVNIAPTSAPWGPSSANTISGTSGGTLTFEKDTTSPSAPIVVGGNDVNLGTFKATAYGESIKIETLTGGFTFTDGGTTNAAATLRNGRILVSTDGTNWVQYGSTATLLAAGTSYTLNYTVVPGTPIWVQLRADIYDNDGTGSMDADDTLLGKIIAGSSNAQRTDSLGSLSVPSSAVSANTLNVDTATMTLSKNATYATAQSTSFPATNFKIASYNLAGSAVEDILLTTLSLDVDAVVNATLDDENITNMYAVIKDASGNVVAQPSPLATLTAGGQDSNYSINYTLLKNANVTIEFFANFSGTTPTAADSFKTILKVSGTSLVSGSAVTSGDGATTVEGQTIAYAASTITVSKDASSPVTAIVYDNQTVTTLAAKFVAVTAAYNLTGLTVTLGTSANTVVQSVELWDGTTKVGTAPMSTATTAVFSGLNWNIPATQSKVLTVKVILGSIGVGAGTTGATITTSIAAATDAVYTNVSTGVSTSTSTEEAGTATGSSMYAYAATPTITNVALPETTLSNGTKTVAKFSVASNGGTIGWKYLAFTITKVMSGTDTLADAALWDVDTNTQVAGTAAFTDTVDVNNDTAGGMTFVADDEQQISGTKTYVLKMTVAGATTAGDYLSVNIAQPLTAYDAPDDYATVLTDDATATFVWTDQSVLSHSATTEDWNHGYLVKNLPTDTQTLTY